MESELLNISIFGLSIMISPDFIAGASIGYILGALTVIGVVTRYARVPKGDILAWLVAFVWIVAQVYSVLKNGAGLPEPIFNLVGGMSVGHIVGYDVVKALVVWMKK